MLHSMNIAQYMISLEPNIAYNIRTHLVHVKIWFSKEYWLGDMIPLKANKSLQPTNLQSTYLHKQIYVENKLIHLCN